MKTERRKSKLENRHGWPFQPLAAGLLIGGCLLLLSLGTLGRDGKHGLAGVALGEGSTFTTLFNDTSGLHTSRDLWWPTGAGTDDARLGQPQQSDGSIPAGEDCWFTKCEMPASLSFSENPIPAGFFGPGSEPFDGMVSLGGRGEEPDTVLRRLEGLDLPHIGSAAQVPIQLVALSLMSCQPIVVTSSGQSNLWDVVVGLSDTPVENGSMTVTKTHESGGTFNADFFVQPRFIFTKVDDPTQVRVFDTGAMRMEPERLETLGPMPWSHRIGPSLGVDPCGANFIPGVATDSDGKPCCVPVCNVGPSLTHCTFANPGNCPVCPVAGVDRFDSFVEIELQLGTVDSIVMRLAGPTMIRRGNPGDGIIDAEIVELNLVGLDPLGHLVQLEQSGARATLGRIIPVDPGAAFFPATSSFQVFVDFFLEIAEFHRYRNVEPILVEARIDTIPPLGVVFRTPDTFHPVPLVDDADREVGRITRVEHHVGQPALFSVAPDGPSGLDPADILAPGTPPVVVISRASLGLLPGDDIDALSAGRDFLSERFENFPRFSVDPKSMGVPGSAVRIEASCAPPEAHGDEFGLKPFGPDSSPCSGNGPNSLCYDENGIPCGLLAPKVGLLISDDLDALTEALPNRTTRLFFSLAPGSPTLASLGAGPADILVSQPGGTPLIFATAEGLRLRPDDDIDALCLMEDGDPEFDPDKDDVRFSLNRDSPSLRRNSPADILRPGRSGPTVVVQESDLGLRGGRSPDNLNALKCRSVP